MKSFFLLLVFFDGEATGQTGQLPVCQPCFHATISNHSTDYLNPVKEQVLLTTCTSCSPSLPFHLSSFPFWLFDLNIDDKEQQRTAYGLIKCLLGM